MLLVLWAAGLIGAFGLLQWSVGLRVAGLHRPLLDSLYFSAGTAFTLMIGPPANSLSRLLMAMEAGLGFGFLALVIGYLPVLYESFASREWNTTMLDARGRRPASGRRTEGWEYGAPKCWRVTFPIQCWLTFVRSIRRNPG